MIKKLALLLTITLLVSCGNKKAEEGDIKWITPAGAPALAFYDQGNNPNYVTNGTPTLVAAELQKNDYDVVVFDAVNGLKSIKKNNANYKLAKVITGGNLYLACINKTPDEQGNYPLPSVGDKIVSFGEGLLPDLVYKKLASDKWSISNTPTYVESAADAQAVLVAGKHAGTSVDYVVCAEPGLTAAMSNTQAETYGKVGIVKSLRAEWKAFSGQDGIVQAGVFVHNKTVEEKPTKIKDFMNELSSRIDVAISDPDKVVASLNLYGDSDAQKSRFGFAAPIVKKVQANGNNGFGLVSSSQSIDVNAFLTSLGQPTFEDSYFVNI